MLSTVQKTSAAVPLLNSPPPSVPAGLAERSLRVTSRAPVLKIPPPSAEATLPSIDEPRITAVPALATPPPFAAALPTMASPDRVTVPWLSSPPPSPEVTPPVMVRPERLGRGALVDLEDAARPAPADGQLAEARPDDHDRPGGVAQLELAGGQGDDRLLGEGRPVEGDGGAAVEDVGEVDGLAEAELPESRAEAVDGRVDDQRAGLRLEGADVGRGVEREAALVGGHPGDGDAGVGAGLLGWRAIVSVGPP